MDITQKTAEHGQHKSDFLPPLGSSEVSEVKATQPAFSGMALGIFATAFAIVGAFMATVFS